MASRALKDLNALCFVSDGSLPPCRALKNMCVVVCVLYIYMCVCVKYT